MVRYTVEEDVILYQNNNVEFPMEIKSVYSTIIPIKEESQIKHVDIIFHKGQSNPQGIIEIDIRYAEKCTFYKVDLTSIPNDHPLRLSFEKAPVVKDKLSISFRPHYKTDDTVYVWINRGGICAEVYGYKNKKYEFKYSPLISIITPLYKTDIDSLKELVESVKQQYYLKWELCLVDDASKSVKLSRYLESIKSKKIRVKVRSKNGGIAEASNTAISMASGQYICFLDHDDLITRDALQEVVSVLNKHPETGFIYSDEDKIDDQGGLSSPFYKPDWNYSLFLSHMYTCHLGVYKKSIIDKIGGFRRGYDGSQDYDLVLRVIEETSHIRHIPKILYHWRKTSSSTSTSIMNKPEARINAARAIKSHLDRCGLDADVEAGPFQGHYHVVYRMASEPKVSIIIPFKDQVRYLKNLIHTLGLTSYENYEVVLVDNNSEKRETTRYLKDISSLDDRIRILKYGKKFNFSAINNYAVGCCGDADLVLFLNNDTEIMHRDWLKNMAQHFVRPEIAAVGAKLLYLDHRIQHAGIYLGVNGVAAHGHKKMPDWMPGYFSRPHMVQEISAVTGACMLVRRDKFLEVGGFDVKLSKAFNDIDLCLKLRSNNYLILYTPYARLYHHESISRGLDSLMDKRFQDAIAYMNEKWGVLGYEDPYYNPNLTKVREDFSYIR